MITYYYQLQDIPSEHFIKHVSAGSRTITFEFQWAFTAEEQLNDIYRVFTERSMNDPLVINNNTLDREYDYYTYYMDLVNKDLNTWLDTNPILPRSLMNLTKTRQVNVLNTRIAEVRQLQPIISQYLEILRWQCVVTSTGTEKTISVVEPGGWFRNGNNVYSFRFVSDKERIGKEDLSSVYIEIEVYS